MTDFEKKQWLSRYQELMEIVEEEADEAGYWKEKAFSLSSQKLDPSGVTSTSRNSNMTDHIVKFLYLASECAKHAEEAEKSKQEIVDAINGVDNKDCRRVLRYRYIKSYSYFDIARKMKYSNRMVYYLHKKGLNLLNIPKDCSKLH